MIIGRRAAMTGLLLLAAGPGACVRPALRPQAPPASGHGSTVRTARGGTLEVGDGANGAQVRLRPGEKLIAGLSGESDYTGFAWKLISGTGRAVALIDRGFLAGAGPPAPGHVQPAESQGRAVFTFAARHAGYTTLRLGLFPPGEGWNAERRFTLHVLVTAR